MQDVQFVGGYKVADNGFGLGEVADFENKTSYQNLIRQFCMLALVAPFYH